MIFAENLIFPNLFGGCAYGSLLVTKQDLVHHLSEQFYSAHPTAYAEAPPCPCGAVSSITRLYWQHEHTVLDFVAALLKLSVGTSEASVLGSKPTRL